MKKENVFVGSAVLAAAVSSLCCVLPLLAVIFGLGAFGAAAAFDELRPYLLVVAFAAIAFGFYRVYFRNKQCAEGENCSTERTGKSSRFFLWASSLVILGFALAPYYAGYIAAAITSNTTHAAIAEPIDPATAASPDAIVAAEATTNRTVVIGVRGMTCAACETHIEESLKGLAGVVSADADYRKRNVTVVYNPEQITVKRIRAAVAATGYELI